MNHQIVSPKIYCFVFGALIFFTALTVFAAFFDLGVFNTVVALAIAIMKASLVVLFFMHVWYSSSLVKVFAAAGVFWLLILLVFTFSDYLTRSWQSVPQGWT